MRKLILSSFLLLVLVSIIMPANIYGIGEEDDIVIDNGVLYFETTGIAATTDTRYRTTGFIIHREARYGNPTQGGPYAEIALQQVGQSPPNPSPGEQVTTYFEVPESLVSQALVDAGMGDIGANDIIRLSAVFQIIENGELLPTKYRSKEAIRNARAWADPGVFDQYYDRTATYSDPPDFAVDVIYRTEDGSVLQSSRRVGEYTAGTGVGVMVEESFDNINGKAYELVQSYIQPSKNASRKENVQNVGDPALSNRNVHVYIKGTNVVGVYREVAGDQLVGFRISPKEETIELGGSQQYEAFATYLRDGTEEEVEVPADQVAWSSANLDVAEMSSSGLATSPGYLPGSVYITGTYEGLEDTALLHVNPNRAIDLFVEPPLSTIAVDDEENYEATLLYSAGTSENLNPRDVTWTSSDPSIATINSDGVATGHSPGRVTITGTYEDLEDTATLTVIAGDITGDFTINPNPVEYGNMFDFTQTSLVNNTGKEIQTISWVIHNPDSDSGTAYPKETASGVTVRYFMYPSFLTDETKDYEVSMRVWLEGEDEPRHLNSKVLHILGTESDEGDDGDEGDDDGDNGDDGGDDPDPDPDPDPPNNPPWVEVWFEKDGNRIERAVQGDTVELHASFGDPDDDPLVLSWQYNNPMDSYGLSRSAPVQTIKLVEHGLHSATLTVYDPYGLTAHDMAYIDVIDPTPVAVIIGPVVTKEGRPLVYPIDGSNSYSPISIPLVEYDWTNKQDVYDTPGMETVTLRVQDEDGRWSKRVEHHIHVIPDEPPVAQLEVPSETTRLNQVTIQITSFSPDFDPLDEHHIEVRYDPNNSGNYGSWQTLAEGDIRSFVYDPEEVGYRQFRVTSCESFGLCDTSDPVTMEVVNLPPHVDVDTSGDLEHPSDKTVIPMSTIFNSWTLREPSGTSGDKDFWRMNSGMLETYVTSNLLEFNSMSAPTNGYDDREKFMMRSFTQGRDNPGQTIYSSIQSNHFNVTQLSNFSTGQGLHHDEQFVYTFGENSTELKAYTKNFLSVWSHTYEGYNRLYQLVSHDGKLYAMMEKTSSSIYLVTINRSNGQIEAEIQIPDSNSGVSNRTQIVTIYDHRAILSGSSGGHVVDLLYDHVSSIPGFNVTQQNYYRVGEDRLYIYEHTGSTERLRTFKLDNMSMTSSSSLPSSSGVHSRGHSFVGFNEHFEVLVLDKDGSVRAYYDFDDQSITHTGNLTWYNLNGQKTHPRVYSSGSNTDEFRDHPLRMIPEEGHPDRNTLNDYYYEVGPFRSPEPLYNFGEFIGVNASEQLFFNYHSSLNEGMGRAYSGIVVYNGYGEIIRPYERFSGFIPKGMYEGADGLTTIYGERNGDLQIVVFDPHLNVVVNETINMDLPSTNHAAGSNTYRYIDDHTFFVYNDGGSSAIIDASGGPSPYPKLFEPAVSSFDHIWYGGATLQNEVQELILKPTESVNQSVGMAFRVKDNRNYYSVEFENGRLYFNRVQNGTKTNLRNTAYTLAAGSTYRVKVVPNGFRYQVYVNDIFQFEHTDNRFSDGRMGIINRGAAGMQYMELSYSTPGPGAGTISGVALVGETIHYDVTYEDPEGDPKRASADRWVYTHDPSVFINPQGTWPGSGQQRNTAVTSFDYPGEYYFTYRTQDHPHPSAAFSGYRQYSNTVSGTIRIHRAPVAQFTVTEQSDHTLRYTDRSYDPDRYDPATGNYSRENTGINYQTTRGIVEHRWRWRETVSSTYTSGILTNPSKAGEYIIELAVRDEYGAWSDWYSQTITVSGAAGRDDPPRAGFTVSPSSTYRGVGVTINSTASDREDGGRTNLEHAYYIRNLTEGGGVSFQSNSRTSWTKVFNTMGTFEIRQVVTDSAGQTDQAIRQVTISNRRPVANVQSPGSTSSANPQVIEETRPTIRWTYSDADGDTQQRFQVRISYTNGQNAADSGMIDGSVTQWQPSHGLPEDVHLRARVRVHDGYEWSNWSNMRHFIIHTNKPPTADLDWSPKPVWEGDVITLLPEVSDPDLDVLTMHYTVVTPSGMVLTFNESMAAPYTGQGPSFIASDPGNYIVTMTVTDGRSRPLTVQKSIPVGPLGVIGFVEHTPDWEDYRQRYNARYPEQARPAHYFYAGEVFMLRAVVTDTLDSATTAEQVTVNMEGESRAERLSSSAPLIWTGEMLRDHFDELPEGEYVFTFSATWSNGVVTTDEVTIRIVGNIWQTVGVHRVR